MDGPKSHNKKVFGNKSRKNDNILEIVELYNTKIFVHLDFLLGNVIIIIVVVCCCCIIFLAKKPTFCL